MFATLLGGLPRPTADDNDLDATIAVAIRAQEEAGLEPVTDGRLRDPGFNRLVASLIERRSRVVAGASLIEVWRAALTMTDRAVKQALPGPYSVGRKLATGSNDRAALTLEVAQALAAVIDALAEAGCSIIEIEETEAHRIGTDEAERQLFRDAHRRLVEPAASHGDGIHLSLSIVGGSAAAAGAETILDAPYASFAFDLIAGPENWDLAAAAPGDRGVIVGVLSNREGIDEPREVQLWAAHYAASTGGRGPIRVGLGSAGSWANLTWEAAVRKMQLIGETARLAALPPGEELARSVDPASVSARRAALGHPRRSK